MNDEKNPLSDGARKRPNLEKTEAVHEPKFRPPEDMLNEGPDKQPTDPRPNPPQSKKPKKGGFNPIVWFQDLSRKQQLVAAVVAAVVLLGGGVGAWALLGGNEPAPVQTAAKEKSKEEPKAEPIYSPLTGMPVTKEQSELPVIGVMIENSPDARPQSGLHQAGVVFEAIAEGGITRFLALFQEGQPDYVGPVRSVRPYYVDWLQGFDAAVAHVGGSGEALQKIKDEGVKDLDQFSNPGPFNRVRNRYAPHNMYTSLQGLVDVARQKGFNSSDFTGFPRKKEAPSATPNAKSIKVTISGRNYDIAYDYDAASNSYKRLLAGVPHVDERSKTHLSPKVVVVLVTQYGIHANGVNSVYKTVGNGTAFIFQDGIATEGTWEKASAKAQIVFKDKAAKPIALNPGQTWITATSLTSNVSFTP